VNKKIVIGVVVVVALSAAFFTRGMWKGEQGGQASEPAAPGENAAGGHGGEEKAQLCARHGAVLTGCPECWTAPQTREGLAKVKCDHGKGVLDCPDCGSEAGLARVEPPKQGASVDACAQVEPVEASVQIPAVALRTVGQISLNDSTVVHVSPRIGGIVTSAEAQLGQKVFRGDVLAEIDSIELREAAYNHSKAAALLELARKQYEREKGLLEKKLCTQQEALDAEARLEEAKVELEMAKKKLLLLGVEEKDFAAITTGDEAGGKRLAVKAPSDGVVIGKHAAAGEMVTPESELFTVADLGSLWIWLDIYEREYPTLMDAMANAPVEVRISVGALPSKAFSGEIDYVSGSMNEESRTVKVRVSLDNAEGLLKTGMFATCDVLIPLKERLVVPANAVAREGGAAFVFKDLGGGLFVRQGVLTGEEFADVVEIKKGISAGDKLANIANALIPAKAHVNCGGSDEVTPRTREELAKTLCDHKKSVLECIDCGWEAGVVLVDPSLATGKEDSLLQVAAAKAAIPTTSLKTVGQISLNGNKVVHVSPRIGGVVASAEAQLGQRVSAGDILAEIDSMELREAAFNHAKASALFELAKKQYERQRGLAEKKLCTQQEALDAEARFEEAKVVLEMAKKRLLLLGVEEKDFAAAVSNDSAKAKLLAVRAPFDGVVIEKHAIAGEMVTPGNDLFTVADLGSLWIWLDVYEREYEALFDAFDFGKVTVRISVSSLPSREFTGELDYMAGAMSTESRTVKVRVSLDNADGLLKPGMFATCEIVMPLNEERVLVPPDAVLKDGENSFVFKDLGGGLFVRQGVTTGRTFSDGMEINEGLAAGDRVMARGGFMLKGAVLREKMGAG
jgi:cobalt-zinc-cadmium efflux system membrane fusion protein